MDSTKRVIVDSLQLCTGTSCNPGGSTVLYEAWLPWIRSMFYLKKKSRSLSWDLGMLQQQNRPGIIPSTHWQAALRLLNQHPQSIWKATKYFHNKQKNMVAFVLCRVAVGMEGVRLGLDGLGLGKLWHMELVE